MNLAIFAATPSRERIKGRQEVLILSLARQADSKLRLVGELTTEVHINTAEIPTAMRDNLSAATLDLIHAILHQPGGRELLDARTAARKAAAAAK